DIRAAASRAARGGVLTADALADIAATIEGALRARRGLHGHELAPALSVIAAAIEPGLSQLAEEIRRVVDDDGAGLRDTASPHLRRLRRDLRTGRQRAEEALQRLARAPALRAHLQETFIVQRAGRPVLAVKASSRSSLPGIVHDASGSRQPLLDPAAAVPIDLEFGLLRTIVISGPNTGGKTVALKTMGLAVLLHQSGLRPPAAEAELPIFDAALVEIGDQQSIAMSLSTFAAHVRNLIAILESATPASLVLIDEPASGTDPVEGAALAQALLERLAQDRKSVV